MRQVCRAAAVVGILGIALASASVSAHHAIAGQFDQDKRATLTGVMTKIMWVNPHVRWTMDVKDPETGRVTTWDISGGAPSLYRSIGITGRDVFKVGETYTAVVALARDGSNLGHVFMFIMPDGRKLDLWQGFKN